MCPVQVPEGISQIVSVKSKAGALEEGCDELHPQCYRWRCVPSAGWSARLPRFVFEDMASGIFLVKLDLSAQLLLIKSEKQISRFLTLNGRSAIPF